MANNLDIFGVNVRRDERVEEPVTEKKTPATPFGVEPQKKEDVK